MATLEEKDLIENHYSIHNRIKSALGNKNNAELVELGAAPIQPIEPVKPVSPHYADAQNLTGDELVAKQTFDDSMSEYVVKKSQYDIDKAAYDAEFLAYRLVKDRIDFYSKMLSGDSAKSSLTYSRVIGWLSTNDKITIKKHLAGDLNFAECLQDDDIVAAVEAVWDLT